MRSLPLAVHIIKIYHYFGSNIQDIEKYLEDAIESNLKLFFYNGIHSSAEKWYKPGKNIFFMTE